MASNVTGSAAEAAVEETEATTEADSAIPAVIWAGYKAPPCETQDSFVSLAKLELEPSDFADPNVAVIVKHPDYKAESSLPKWLEEGSSDHLFRPRIYALEQKATEEDVGNISATVARIITERYTALARRNVELTRQLFEVRRVHEDLQMAFERVENYLHANDLSEPKLLLELPAPGPEASAPLLTVTDTPVSVSLPYELNKIAGVSIYIESVERLGDANGCLQTTLISGTGGTVYGRWNTPVKRLPEKGWFTFLMDELPVDYGHSLRIVLNCDTGAEISLGLSDQGLLNASVTPAPVAGTAKEQAFNLPALRLWSGLPGTRMAYNASMRPFDFPAHVESDVINKIPIHIAEDNVEEEYAASELEFPPVITRASEQSVQVHPVNNGVVIAKIVETLPEDAFKIGADVGTFHEDSSQVEFSMTVAQSGEQALQAFTSNEDAEWVTAGYDNAQSMVIECDASTQNRNLYLATRIPSDGHNRYAWARFYNLMVEL